MISIKISVAIRAKMALEGKKKVMQQLKKAKEDARPVYQDVKIPAVIP